MFSAKPPSRCLSAPERKSSHNRPASARRFLAGACYYQKNHGFIAAKSSGRSTLFNIHDFVVRPSCRLSRKKVGKLPGGPGGHPLARLFAFFLLCEERRWPSGQT